MLVELEDELPVPVPVDELPVAGGVLLLGVVELLLELELGVLELLLVSGVLGLLEPMLPVPVELLVPVPLVPAAPVEPVVVVSVLEVDEAGGVTGVVVVVLLLLLVPAGGVTVVVLVSLRSHPATPAASARARALVNKILDFM